MKVTMREKYILIYATNGTTKGPKSNDSRHVDLVSSHLASNGYIEKNRNDVVGFNFCCHTELVSFLDIVVDCWRAG
jgi:hypothetical protein